MRELRGDGELAHRLAPRAGDHMAQRGSHAPRATAVLRRLEEAFLIAVRRGYIDLSESS